MDDEYDAEPKRCYASRPGDQLAHVDNKAKTSPVDPSSVPPISDKAPPTVNETPPKASAATGAKAPPAVGKSQPKASAATGVSSSL